MAKGNITIPIPGELESAASEQIVSSAYGIYDYNKGKRQEDVNKETDESLTSLSSKIDSSVNTEKVRAEAAEKALSNRVSDVEQLEKISISGGDAEIATGEDFNNPTAEQRVKIATVGSILDGTDDEPTAGSENLVKSGDIDLSLFKRTNKMSICIKVVANHKLNYVLDVSNYNITKYDLFSISLRKTDCVDSSGVNVIIGSDPIFINVANGNEVTLLVLEDSVSTITIARSNLGIIADGYIYIDLKYIANEYSVKNQIEITSRNRNLIKLPIISKPEIGRIYNVTFPTTDNFILSKIYGLKPNGNVEYFDIFTSLDITIQIEDIFDAICIDIKILSDDYVNIPISIKEVSSFYTPVTNYETSIGFNRYKVSTIANKSLLETFYVSDKEGILIQDFIRVGLLNTEFIDTAGVVIILNKNTQSQQSFTIGTGEYKTVNFKGLLSTITISRSASGVIGTGDIYIDLQLNTPYNKLLNIIDSGYFSVDYNNITDNLLSGYYYNSSGNLVEFENSVYCSPIDISEFAGKGFNLIMYITVPSPGSRYILITDKNEKILSSISNTNFYNNNSNGYLDLGELPINAKYLKFSHRSDLGNTLYYIINRIKQETKISRNLVYVDPINGSDDNTGFTENSPLSTISKAIDITGEDTTIMYLGGDSSESVNIKRKQNQRSLTIVGKQGVRNRFIYDSDKIAEAIQYQDNIYYVERDNFIFDSFPYYYMFQHEIPDSNTKINDIERHPLQRGREYRSESTKLTKASSVEELINSEDLKYYWDSENNRLYFKIVDGSDLHNNPIILPHKKSFIYGNDGTVKINLINIDVWYGGYNLKLCHGAIINNCSTKFNFNAGGFVWDNSVGIKFYKCESSNCTNGTNTGDGFNAHSTESEYPLERHTTSTLIDCWSHDNNDDGYSDHERCECLIQGGLYEYNGKAGITPAFGSHLVCYNTISRKNLNGFYYVGEISDTEGGMYGQAIFYNCVAENNTQYCGFGVYGNGNSIKCISCKSVGNPSGYYAKNATYIELIDCGTFNDSSIKSISKDATIIINNTTIVE